MKISCFALGVLGFCTLGGCRTPADAGDANVKVLGGESVAESDERFKAVRQLIGVKGNCTGTFVTTTKMVTAGHCVVNDTDGGVIGIQPGNLGKSSAVKNLGVLGRPAAQAVFGTTNAYKDVVVMSFSTPKAVSTLPICASGATVGEAVYIVGYGLSSLNNADEGKRFAVVKVKDLIPANGSIKLESGKSTMPGDSGGPLISVERHCVLGVASYLEPVSQTVFRSYYVDLSAPKVKSFLAAAGLTGGVGGDDAGDGTAVIPGGADLKGRLCQASGGSVRRFEFLTASKVRDTNSSGAKNRLYTLDGGVLTVKLPDGTQERYKVSGDGQKLVPSKTNAVLAHFVCQDGPPTNPPTPTGPSSTLAGKTFINEDGFSMTFVSKSKLRLDDDPDTVSYQILGETLAIKNGASVYRFKIETHDGGLQLTPEDPGEQPYRCAGDCN